MCWCMSMSYKQQNINNKLFCAQQYGFMKNASTELASLELIDRLLNQLNDHKIPINLHLNLTK